jgi:ATP-dependent DNA helicase RecG
VFRLKGVGPRRAADLARLGVERAEDLLTLWPRRHEDRTRVVPIALLGLGTTATVVARVADVRTRYVPGRDMLATVTVTDGTGVLDVVFFHARFIARHFVPGRRYIFTGRVERRGHRLSMVHPAWEPTDEETDRAGIVPVYPLAGDLTQRWLRGLMAQVVPELAAQTADPLPEELRRRLGFPPRPWALAALHFPPSLEDKERARARLVFDEVLVLALGVQWLRLREGGQDGPGVVQRPDGPTVRRFLQQLPFSLTPGQRRAWEEIARDLARPVPMARLLQGDVGSGKTVLAALACCAAVDAGGQAAVMAPTELLADQQAMVLRRWLEPLGVSVARLTGTDGPRSPVRDAVAAGRVSVVVGTQALIQEGVRFSDLTLVIVDEQHRFGVRQRSRLTGKGRYPDLLVMTATPIPRTLALTIYGDLEISVIDDLPPGRRPVKTVRVDRRHRKVAYEAVREAVRRGEQAYVVCPFVEESEGTSARNAVGLYEGMRRVAGWRVGLLHGRMPAAAKEAVMEQFRQGTVDVLVATSIVEVGVDVPNATIMVVEDADRFGLAQLHQLRGRVGRGSRPGTCYLVADPGSEETEARLNALVELHDGLALAEVDLRIRGPGEVLGLRQHGLAGFQLADPIRDLDALQRARDLAREILARDPDLRAPEHAELRRLVLEALGQAVPASILH